MILRYAGEAVLILAILSALHSLDLHRRGAYILAYEIAAYLLLLLTVLLR